MRPGEFDKELEFQVTVAAAGYGMSRSAFIRMAVQRYCDQLADWQPNIRAAYAMPASERDQFLMIAD